MARRRSSKNSALTIQMEDILDEIRDGTKEACSEAFTIVQKETANDLKTTSPEEHGDYARSWNYKKTGKLSFVVYNKEHYRLTHLLEKGHAKANQFGKLAGRVRARPHIKPARDRAEKRILEEIDKNLDKKL